MSSTTRFTKTDDTFVDVTTGTTLDKTDYPSGWSATNIKSVNIKVNNDTSLLSIVLNKTSLHFGIDIHFLSSFIEMLVKQLNTPANSI